MANTRDLQRRLKSIKSTRKITKAMQLVAAAKMKKAVASALATRTYANLAWMTLLNLSQDNSLEHPFLGWPSSRQPTGKIAMLVFTGNKGLCGGFNSNVINKALVSIKKHPDQQVDFYLFGSRGQALASRYGQTVAASFAKDERATQLPQVIALAQTVMAEYLTGRYDKVLVTFTDFVSTLKQIPRVRQLLPIDISANKDFLGLVEAPQMSASKEFLAEKTDSRLYSEATTGKALEELLPESLKIKAYHYQYNYEPSQQQVLEAMLPRLIEVQLYQANLESNASEQSARMLAMKNASESADELIAALRLTYNKVRQAGITAEIAEICAGANALAN
ncbi:ATP synthase F1 subunit gamma [Candidatus Falkowbacteria bacterium]|nr:ATP synthase F1 subunit gamma [Candidatus Falkowbacteria bacterium]